MIVLNADALKRQLMTSFQQEHFHKRTTFVALTHLDLWALCPIKTFPPRQEKDTLRVGTMPREGDASAAQIV